MLNADLSPEEADQLITDNRIDAAAFGWIWIANPDVVLRLGAGKDLNHNTDASLLYGVGNGAKGYTDYPSAA